MTEADLVYAVETWLVEQGYDTRLELQWRPLARTDLVGKLGTEYVAVEVKIRDWRKALEQAVCQRRAFDKVFIAGRYTTNSKALSAILEDRCIWSNWVGVLAVDGDQVRVLREPKLSPGRSSDYHRAVVALQFMFTSRDGQVPHRPPTRLKPIIVS